MSLMFQANANNSITVSCGGETLHIAIVAGRLVVSAAAPPAQPPQAKPAKQSTTPTPSQPAPTIIIGPPVGPPATGPRTMIRLPGFDEDVAALQITGGKAVCFALKRNELVAPRALWKRLATVAAPKSLHFYLPPKIKR